MKRFLSAVLAFTLFVCLLPFSGSAQKAGAPLQESVEDTYTAVPFTDVKRGAWYYNAVEYAYNNKLFSGTSKTTFSPQSPMTRAMFATVLANKSSNYDPKNYTKSSFSDVKKGSWYFAPVEWAKEMGLVTGVGGGKFDPDGQITREQMSTMMFRYAAKTGNDISLSFNLVCGPNNDDYTSKTSIWAKMALRWALYHKVIAGKDSLGEEIDPKGTATRAEVAQLFYNARNLLRFNYVEKYTDAPSDPADKILKLSTLTEGTWVSTSAITRTATIYKFLPDGTYGIGSIMGNSGLYFPSYSKYELKNNELRIYRDNSLDDLLKYNPSTGTFTSSMRKTDVMWWPEGAPVAGGRKVGERDYHLTHFPEWEGKDL